MPIAIVMNVVICSTLFANLLISMKGEERNDLYRGREKRPNRRVKNLASGGKAVRM